jgi:hypothetical protein
MAAREQVCPSQIHGSPHLRSETGGVPACPSFQASYDFVACLKVQFAILLLASGSPRSFELEPRTAPGIIDPVFKKACCRYVIMLIAKVMRFRACSSRLAQRLISLNSLLCRFASAR